MMKKLIGVLLVLMIAMTQVCVFANSGSGDASGGNPLYTVENTFINDIADVVLKVSDEYPVNGQEVYISAAITAKQDIDADTLKLTYGSLTENISAETVITGATITYDTSIIYDKNESLLYIRHNSDSLTSGGFVFRNELKMELADISVVQTASTENLYEFEVSAVAKNTGSIDAKDYSIDVMKGENVLYRHAIERTNAKETSDAFKTRLTFNKSDFKNNKYSIDFAIVYDRKTYDTKTADAVVTTVLSVENVSGEITADKGDEGFLTKIDGKIKNSGALDSGEIKIDIVSGETVLSTLTIDKVAGFTDKKFSGEVVIPKTAFDGENKTAITAKIKDSSISASCEIVYSTAVNSVLINGSNTISIAQGKTLAVAVSYLPVTAQPGSDAVITIENTETATYADGVITAVAEGTTNICVQVGEETFKVPLTVTRALAEGEIADIKAYTTDASGSKTYRTLYNNRTNTEGFIYSDTNYSVHLNGTEVSAGFEFTLADGQTVYVSQTSATSGNTSTVSDYTNIAVPSRKNRISVNINGTSGITYMIALNKLPELTEDLPETFYAFTNLETNIKLDNYFNDYEDEEKVAKIEFTDDSGKVLGKCEFDTEDGWRWKYTTKETAKTLDATVTVTDKDNGTVSKDIKLVCGKDTEKPTFGKGSVVSASGATSNSVTVSWSKATDNDMIKEYVINYSKSSTLSGARTVTVGAGDGIERRKTISGLNSGTKYYVTVSAYDRSGNYVESDSDHFTTSSGSGGGLGGGSGSGSSGTGSLGNLGGLLKPPASGQTGTKGDKFTDIGNYAWAKEAINTLADRGIVNGVGGSEFSPATNIKRGDFALMIVRAFGFTGAKGVGFSDISAGDYYADAVKTAQALGIINGKGDGRFAPQEFVTRQDMAVMLQRALSKKNISLGTNFALNFNDADSISEYAKHAIGILSNAGIITGDENKNANPHGNATRAELAVMIFRALKASKLIY